MVKCSPELFPKGCIATLVISKSKDKKNQRKQQCQAAGPSQNGMEPKITSVFPVIYSIKKDCCCCCCKKDILSRKPIVRHSLYILILSLPSQSTSDKRFLVKKNAQMLRRNSMLSLHPGRMPTQTTWTAPLASLLLKLNHFTYPHRIWVLHNTFCTWSWSKTT